MPKFFGIDDQSRFSCALMKLVDKLLKLREIRQLSFRSSGKKSVNDFVKRHEGDSVSRQAYGDSITRAVGGGFSNRGVFLKENFLLYFSLSIGGHNQNL